MRFFRRRDRERPAAPEEPEAGAPPDDEEIAAPEDEADADDVPEGEFADEDERAIDASWESRANAVIAGGASTGSKRRDALFGPGSAGGALHFERASGCELTTPGGRRVLDCTMALGAVAIGYADERVLRQVVAAAAAGNVAGLSTALEVEVAERLCDVVPCAERVRFLKSGAEAVAAAVRLARTYTGRSTVIGSGYFGWLDWWRDDKGIPAGAHADFVSVPFDDVAALERAVSQAGSGLAAVVLEPVVERLPSPEWAAAARAACDRAGAVLVFDEIKTGFRLRTGGYQELSGVTPDLATFGKAMANGFPVSAVAGRAEVMDAARATWISSTLAGEATALGAMNAVLDYHEKGEVIDALWSRGRTMRESLESAIASSGVSGVTVDGIDPMWLLRFEDPRQETRFLELAFDYGVLFKRGAYNFPALAHDEGILVDIETAASSALVDLREEEGEGEGEREGEDDS